MSLAAPSSTESSASSYTATPTFALVGNPNCGKTTLFNSLTGMRQKIGNYPGVTVEKKMGTFFTQHGQKVQIIDLPGAYSLSPQSPDETVTRDVLLGLQSDTQRPDRVICVVDSSNLERNLYLVSQILELGIPVIVALNMVDIVHQRGNDIDASLLSKKLGVPVVPCQANKKVGLTELKLAMSQAIAPSSNFRLKVPAILEKNVTLLTQKVSSSKKDSHLLHTRLLLLLTDSNPTPLAEKFELKALLPEIEKQRALLDSSNVDWREDLIAERYQQIGTLVSTVLRRAAIPAADVTDKLDSVFLHAVWGWLIFFALMSFMFLCIFTVASYPMDWLSDFFASASTAIKHSMPPGDLRDLLADGVIAGVGAVVVFLPQILILFFFIGLLEDSGYMARAAFLMDRVMNRVGLHGKSFIPLLSSYACAIPGIMATRTVENPKDRLATILIAPLMSCSARLPVYALMIATLFAGQATSAWTKAAIMMSMYILGTGVAFGCAWIFKRTFLKGEKPPLILELPPYRRPVMLVVLHNMFTRAKAFLLRAGTVILGLSIVLWFLMSFPRQPGAAPSDVLRNSFAGQFGRGIEPLIKPLGFNWKIGIGLVGAQAAREVFVSTMSIVYSVEGGKEATEPLRDAFLADHWADGCPVYTPLVCLSVMIFFVLSMQCISTLAVMRRETNSWRWPAFAFVYMTGLAYVVTLVVYQLGTHLGY